MRAPKIRGFCKNEDCPSSIELLEFQLGKLTKKRSRDIRNHMEACEFCSAEVAFYSHYPLEDGAMEMDERTEIPAPLYELAEALLRNRNGDASSLDLLLNEKVLLTDKV